MKIKLDQSQNDNFGQSLNSILSVLEDLSQNEDKIENIEFDMSKINFVHPSFILPLSVYVDYLN